MSRLRKSVVPFSWNTITANFTQGVQSSFDLVNSLRNPQKWEIVYSVVGTLPTGVTLTGSLVEYNGSSPVANASVRFRATSRGYDVDSASTVVSIAAPTGNAPPVWLTAAALGDVPANAPFSFTLSASDAESDPINFSYVDPSVGSITVQPQAGGTRALVWSGVAPSSGAMSFTATVTSVTPLGQVTGFAANASTNSVALTWTAVANATSYVVERSLTGSGDWTPVGTPTGALYTDSGLTASTVYWYRVKAVNATQEGAYSASVSGMTQSVPTGSADWLARSTAPDVVWAHDFSTPQTNGTNAELLANYIPTSNADYGEDVILGTHPPEVCPHVGSSGGRTYFEVTLLGATLAEDMASADLPVQVNGALTATTSTTGTLTLPVDLGYENIFSTFKITSGLNSGRFFRATGNGVADGLGNFTVSVKAGDKQPALVNDSGFTWQHCKTGDPSNPIQTITIDESIALVGRQWPNPSKPAPWSASNPSVIPDDVYTVVVQRELGGTLGKYKDKLAVYSVQPHATNPNWTTLVVRRAAIPGNGTAGRIENDWINQSFPCDFLAGSSIGRDSKGGWSRPLAALPPSGNGLSSADNAASGTVPVRQWYTVEPGTWKFRTGFYGHSDYHGIWNSGNSFSPNTYPANGVNPYNGDEFWLAWEMYYTPSWILSEATSKAGFLDCYQQERNSQIVWGPPTQDERRWKWYHNKGSDSNSRLSQALANGDESYEPGSQWEATCILGQLTQLGVCWQPPVGEWFAVKLHIKAGHDNELRHDFGDGVTVSQVVSTGGSVPDPLVIRTPHFPLKAGMTWNMDGTGGYFCTQADEGNPQIGVNAQGKPIGLDPQKSGYFNGWALDISTGPTSNTLYGSFKIVSHVVVDGVSEFTLTKKRPLDSWPTSLPAVGAKVRVGINGIETARYRDSYIKLYKKEASDSDWVLVSDLQKYPISFALGAAPSENPPGWNEFQPTGYANVDDNNLPPNLTKSTRTTRVILSHADIAAPDL